MWIVNKVMYGLITLIFVYFLTGFLQQFAFGSIPSEPLLDALHSTGGKVKEVSINGWGQLPDGNFTAEQLSGMAGSAMSQLGLNKDDYTISQTEDARRLCVRAEAVQDELHAVILVQTLKAAQSEAAKGYVVVNIELNNSNNRDLINWQQQLKNIIKEFGCLPHINTCLTGWLDGKLLKEEWGIRLENAFQAAKATTVDRIQYTDFASYTGYSPVIADYVQYGNKKVNVNIAMRYSPHDNRTYIIVGSPVITREY
ncbi:MAG: YwmB family TATA-box binding protein [Pelosinus sp.]|nr:YwmB family TATA-box binding protein [Pelosinus sp.]